MALRIEDYALVGNTRTAALVGRDGSVDWLCMPRFDSAACFAALLGTDGHGRWLLSPRGVARRVRRRYRPGTLVLESEFSTEDGTVRLVDFMPHADGSQSRRNDLVRIVEGIDGRVPMRMEWIVRFEYGSVVPWVRRAHGGLMATAGAESVVLYSPVETRGEGMTTVADFEIGAGQVVPFTMTHLASHCEPPLPADPRIACELTTGYWRRWRARCDCDGDAHADAVGRSLLTLKALTYAPTGGIVAAPTTSLPEFPGGERNWDYRFCWLRDATFTLYTLLQSGFEEEAVAWRDWLLRTVAGRPQDLRALYGICGERRLPEVELDWLPGYEHSSPVRVGNGASGQLQLDVFGELMDTLHLARNEGVDSSERAWAVQQSLLEFLETKWDQPDNGIWEIRFKRQRLTHSNVMCWVAFDRAVRTVERFGLEGPLERWKSLREQVRRDVCEQGYNRELKSFVQSFGGSELDASLLLLPLVGFLPPDDERIRGTVAAVERELLDDGFVRRYRSREDVDGMPAGEGAFLPCSFWLADNYALRGESDKARRLLDRLVGLANDVGLLPEEYDPATRRFLGNFPQAFTHVALVNSARNLGRRLRPGEHRARMRTECVAGSYASPVDRSFSTA